MGHFRATAFFLASLAGADPAPAADWVVAEVSGQAWITSPAAPASRAAAGVTVQDGATISTGVNGRAILGGADITIVIGPNTTLSPQGTSFWGTMRLVHRIGRVEIATESRGFRSVEVQTPFLVASAKSGQFSVTVSGRNAAVSVARGEVEVTDRLSRQVSTLRAGETVATQAAQGRGLDLGGGLPPSEVEATPVPLARPEAAPPAKESGTAAPAPPAADAGGRDGQKGGPGPSR